MVDTGAIQQKTETNTQAQAQVMTNAQALNGKIQARADDLGSVQKSIQQLMKAIAKLKADVPDPSKFEHKDGKLTEKGRADLQAARNAHMQQVQGMLDEVEDLYTELGKIQAEIEHLTAQMPGAQAQDAADMLRTVEQERAQLDAMASLATETIDAVNETEQKDFKLRWVKKDVEVQTLKANENSEAEAEEMTLKTAVRFWTFAQEQAGDTAGGQLGTATRSGLEVQAQMPDLNTNAWSGQQKQDYSDLSAKISDFARGVTVTGQKASVTPASQGQPKPSPGSVSLEQFSASVQGKWADFVAGLKLNGAADVNALVQAVLREAYMENTNDLRFYAEKVKYFNEYKKVIRDELTRARNAKADATKALGTTAPAPGTAITGFPAGTWVEGTSGQTVGISPGQKDSAGNVQPWGTIGTWGDMEKYISSLEEQLNSVGDDAQLANVDLQNMLQKQQQTLQLMSNISKMLHETAIGIIRKIG